jgi:hypothetical protein
MFANIALMTLFALHLIYFKSGRNFGCVGVNIMMIADSDSFNQATLYRYDQR